MRVEHAHTSLRSKVQTNDTHLIYNKTILVASEMLSKPCHQSRVATWPCTHVVLPCWSLPHSPPPGYNSQEEEDALEQASATARVSRDTPHTVRSPSCLPVLLKCCFVHTLNKGEIAIMHIQNELKPNMTRQLWICSNWWIRHFSTSPLFPLLTEKSS